MNGVNFSTDDWETMRKIIESIYVEADSWDFKIEITKEKEHYDIWIGDKDE